jgi:hypothetical protein
MPITFYVGSPSKTLSQIRAALSRHRAAQLKSYSVHHNLSQYNLEDPRVQSCTQFAAKLESLRSTVGVEEHDDLCGGVNGFSPIGDAEEGSLGFETPVDSLPPSYEDAVDVSQSPKDMTDDDDSTNETNLPDMFYDDKFAVEDDEPFQDEPECGDQVFTDDDDESDPDVPEQNNEEAKEVEEEKFVPTEETEYIRFLLEDPNAGLVHVGTGPCFLCVTMCAFVFVLRLRPVCLSEHFYLNTIILLQ